jgi:hypothetical protein
MKLSTAIALIAVVAAPVLAASSDVQGACKEHINDIPKCAVSPTFFSAPLLFFLETNSRS